MSLKITYKEQDFFVGDSIKVNYKIKEKDKERLQAFDGIILAVTGTGENKNFIVQKSASDAVKVERIFPVNSPWIESIKKLRSPKTKIRRAKLYYLRDPKARSI
ncbi:MAG: 50S ribosomal protein L19 [Candidatus Shapirobacteria bacterium]|nr:50S ribosomal protein L19 [Candidatus Shapirobacteria bacterium]MDD4410433.1 50S ribosomal protein L19 [Candidatus Shapirobacteria bacterium]